MTTLATARIILTNLTKRRDQAKREHQLLSVAVAEQIINVRKLTPETTTICFKDILL